MSWLLIDDQFHTNRKVLRAGLPGTGLYARALSFCSAENTDGWVPKEWAHEVGTAALAKKLTDVGLWNPVRGGETFLVEGNHRRNGGEVRVQIPGAGYYVPDFLHYNPSRREVLETREQRRAAGQKGADSRWHSKSHDENYGKSHGKGYGKPNGKTMPPTPNPYLKNNNYVGPEDVTSSENVVAIEALNSQIGRAM